MSSAPSKRPPSVSPDFDLDYSIHDFEVEHLPDSTFLFGRIEDAIIDEGAVPGGRTLDVACGVGRLTARFQERGAEGWGIEPSDEMLGLSRLVEPRESVILCRGIAESLPYRAASFDRIVCMGALDHFVEPRAFMEEAARVLKPGGRVVIALANYDSLSCRLGRPLQRAYWRLRRRAPTSRPYWEMPHDHYHRGTNRFVRALGGNTLKLHRSYGISLFWLFPGWGHLLAALPGRLSTTAFSALDSVAKRQPGLADTIISVWTKP